MGAVEDAAFDNKSEFQVIVDMPAGTPVEKNGCGLARVGDVFANGPEVSDYRFMPVPPP